MTVLDVGCNEGGFGAALKNSRSMEVWGIEPDTNSAAEARHRLDHVVEDIFHARNPIPDNYFDLITFNDSLEHMPDPVFALELARKKLKAGGRILCCVPNMRHIECLEHLLFEKDWRYEEIGIRDRTHLRFFTRKSVERLFVEMNFSIIDVNFINDEWWEKGRLLRRILFRLFPAFTHDMRFKQVVVLAK
ncbi:class I SAM-dependent methyltransferase [Hydrogenophaga sp.]|uniref:class I SAM-dependent methyltransferase n=1 Tax=Hydrogenophaga sp. TaxID=1904254 RepID=UPI0025C21737|nr:class I SAM-dependent methyltransferase [Hydrogenophaga sp.]MBT9465185.1 class I SAM-dependent methyltransferase [Hydrogenophaga sp.]